MKIYSSIDAYEAVPDVVVTIGTFDGVHVGHMKLIRKIREVAARSGCETLILTFFPHPRMVLYPKEHGVQLLNTMREKETLLSQAGIDHLIVHPFSQEFSQMSSADFIEQIIHKKLNASKLVIGYDHHFGRDRKGSFADLQAMAPRLGFTVDKIEEEDIHDIAVSSTRIRNALQEGDVEQANLLLGRPYSLTGEVVHGEKLGRTLGFPTANLLIPEAYKLIPAEGVYMIKALLDGESFHGMLSIGRRPTIREGGERSVEAFLIGFDREIYGRELTLHLLKRIRPDRKFESLDALKKAMQDDLKTTLETIRASESK